MELSRIKKFIKLEAERILPTENYSLQELWIKEGPNPVPFFCFSQDEFYTTLMVGVVELDFDYRIETIPNQEMNSIVDEFVLLGYSCYSIRG